MGAAKIDPASHMGAHMFLDIEVQKMKETLATWNNLGRVSMDMRDALNVAIVNLEETIALLEGKRNIEIGEQARKATNILKGHWGSLTVGDVQSLAHVVVQMLD